MTTTSKQPVQTVRKGSSTLQSPKLPDRQFDPNRTVERKGQYVMKREQGALRTTVR